VQKGLTRLRAWRERMDWTQPRAASYFDVSIPYWRLLETGTFVPSHEVQARFEAAFGEPYAALLKRADIRGLPTLRTDKASA
jgi:transcriptional regulator with XRE-family HTH domain